MSDYDATLKTLLNHGNEVFRQIGVGRIAEWLNVELPRARNPRIDLLGRTASGELVHIELQSQNDRLMPLRMAEYALALLRRYDCYPHQLVLFVGNKRLSMQPLLKTRGMTFSYEQFDLRQLDGRRLLESSSISDNILAVLTQSGERGAAVREIIRKIAQLGQAQRQRALLLLLSAAELRGLEHTVREEARKVPIIHKTSINNKTFGPWIRKGMTEGLQRGEKVGMRRALRVQLEKRFGNIPAEVNRRLNGMTEQSLEELAVRIIDAKALAELFPPVTKG